MNGSIVKLPSFVLELFWEHAPGDISWERHRDFIVERVLARGDWDAICWVRSQAGDEVLREIIVRTRGRWLSRAQIRFWQLILDLPEAQVSVWLHSESRRIWDRRTA
ncbi:MAG: hypothetical protein ACE5G2_04745 [Candidatus Krumholzibacteriia bacterium]